MAGQSALERERLTKLICAALNEFVDLKGTLTTFLKFARELSGCDAVGVRLNQDGDYPYFVYEGFSDKFILKENSLCSRNRRGERIPDPGGNGFLLDCMCGNILKGKTDASLDFFTEGGSFWANCTSDLLASTDRPKNTRNYCNSVGYESVALVPIRVRGEIIGLIQLNDLRPGRFSEEQIEVFEMIGQQVGLAVQSSLLYEKVKQRGEALERSARELARSNADLEQFAYAASHDLQEPLRAVRGFAELLSRRYQGQLDERADQYLAFIMDGTDRMKHMISDLLAYSRVGSHGSAPAPVHLEDPAREALENLQIAAEEQDAVVEIGSLPTLPMDRTQAVQLFQNLVSNAIKFRGEARPEVAIAASRQPGDDGWTIEVRDNGIGLDPGHAEAVFGLFKRLHSDARYPGTGIGLALCRRIVERHGGKIWLESSPGKGATFYFTLPAG